MPPNRVTQVTGDVVAEGDLKGRVTQVTGDVIAEGDQKARATQVTADVIADGQFVDRVTQLSVDVIADVTPHVPGLHVTQFSVDIIAEPSVNILTPSPLANAFLGDPYSAFIVATGGLGAITFAVTSGALPTGLTLNIATGEISGTPTVSGTFTFDITATDSQGHSDTVEYTILVDSIEAIDPNLGIGVFGLGYTISRGFSGIECHIEMNDVGLGSGPDPISYRRTQTFFPRSYFPADQEFYLEIVGSNVSGSAKTWTVTDGGSNSHAMSIPSGYVGRIRDSVTFDLPEGIYQVVSPSVTVANDALAHMVRIVAPLKRAQKFVSEVRLAWGGGQTSSQDQTIGGPDLFRTSSPGTAGLDDGWVQTNCPAWRYETAAWERIAGITWFVVIANASFPDQISFKYSEIALVDIDDIGEFGFSRKVSSANINIFLTPLLFGLDINPTELRDGHRYQVFMRSVKRAGTFNFNTYLHTSRLHIAVDPGNRSEIYNRMGSRRVYMPGFMEPIPEIYFQVAMPIVDTIDLLDMGASTPAGNTTISGTVVSQASIISAVNDVVRSPELSTYLLAGHDYQNEEGQGELVYRFGDVVRPRSHNYMF